MNLKLKTYVAVTVLCLISTQVTGCVESENDLPSKNLHDDERIVGWFYLAGENGIRTDVRIEKVSGKKGHYVANFEKQTEKGWQKQYFRLFKIGETEFISLRLPDQKGVELGPYLFAKLEVSRTQLVLRYPRGEWFVANPDALTGTDLGDARNVPRTARLKVSSEKLEQFFQLYFDSPTMFSDKDGENRQVYNRSGS